MEKEFVPYEQALALKELGFNEPCFGIYQKNKKIKYCHKNEWITNFQINPDEEILNFHIKQYPKNVSLINGIYFLRSCYNFTAPTFSQAFEFFREKHGFHSYIEIYSDDTFDYTITSKIFTETNDYGDGPFLTFYEAQLACLNQLIKLVKNKL